MSATLAVFRREFGAYFDSPVAWVTTTLFVLTLHALFFFLGYPIGDYRVPGFWEGRVASLQALFAWLPLLFVVLVPAITMGAWAEERRAGTDEILLTLPLRPRHAVLGKFLAAWLLLVLVVAIAVVPLHLVVASLGDVDVGTVVGGFLGACLLGAACVALGLLVSAASQDQLIAFLLAAVLLGALWSTTLFVRVLPAGLAEWVHGASPTTHYLESAARGVFDLRDVVYHGVLSAVGLALTVTLVEARRWR